MATNEELQAAAETVSQLADDLDATKTMTFGSGDVAAMRTLAQHYISHPQPATDEQLAELKRLCAAEYTGTGSWKLVDGSRLCDAGLLLRIKDAVPEIIARLERTEASYATLSGNAAQMLASSYCERHLLEAKSETFREFIDKELGKCLRCGLESVEHLRAENERLRNAVGVAANRIAGARDVLASNPHHSGGRLLACLTDAELQLRAAIAAQQESGNG